MFDFRKQWKKCALLPCWLLLAGLSAVIAQHPFQYKYTLDDGLPHLETTSVGFTKSGELWVGYSNGETLSHFDGLNWTHYPLSEMKLPLRLALLSEDSNGVWFMSQSDNHLNFVCFTKTGLWKTYRFEGKYFPWPDNISGSARFIDAQFFAHHFDPELDAFVKSDKPYFSPKKQPTGKVRGIRITLEGASLLVIQPTEKPDLIGYFENKFEQSFDLPHPSLEPFFVSENDIRGTSVEAGKLYWYAQRQSRPLDIVLPSGRMGEYVDRVYVHPRGTIAFTYLISGVVVRDPQSGTLYLYQVNSLGQSTLLLSHLDGDYYGGSFSQDEQGHWWYGTSTGLVRTNQSFQTFDESNPAMVNGFHAIGEDSEGNIWMGGYNGLGGFAVWDGKKLQRRTFTNDAMGILPGSLRSKAGTLYFFNQNSQGLVAIKNGKFRDIPIPGHEYLHGYYFLQLSNGKIGLGLQGKGIGIAEETDGLISSVHLIGKEKGLLLDNVITIAEDQAGRLWTGRSSQGLAIYDPERDTAVTWLRSPEQPGSIGGMSSCVDENGTLWLGAHNGLYRLERPHEFDYFKNNPIDFIQNIALPGGDTSTVSILQNTPAYLVAGTQLGVYFFDKNYHGDRPRIFSLKYGKDIAGGGSEQNAVLHTPTPGEAGGLWLGTQTGATRIAVDSLRFDTSATEIRLLRFQAADINVSIEEGKIGEIPTGRRTIDFSFAASGNSFFRDNLYYDLAIVNDQHDTLFSRISTREKNLRVDYLPPGVYTLHITALKHNVVSGHAAFAFSVPKMLSERPWFWLALATLLLGIPFTWFYLKKRHQAMLEKAKREQDALKIQVLSNFFNPHFINNSLHWVQSKYRKDPETTALMGRLADNVDILYRNTQSGKAYHILATELELVKNYLKIQQIRFEEALTVQLNLPENQDLLGQVLVPSMLLQIHVENAIEKGIRGRKGASRFSMAVGLREEGCHITIEDDGRGRPAEQEQATARKGSTAVMHDLLALLNSYNRESLTVRYDDHVFHDDAIGGYGTRVVIFIPKNYQYEFS